MTACTEKWLKHSERVGSRFAELNAGSYILSDILPVSWLTFAVEAMGSQPPNAS